MFISESIVPPRYSISERTNLYTSVCRQLTSPKMRSGIRRPKRIIIIKRKMRCMTLHTCIVKKGISGYERKDGFEDYLWDARILPYMKGWKELWMIIRNGMHDVNMHCKNKLWAINRRIYMRIIMGCKDGRNCAWKKMEGCVHVARHLLYEKDAFQDFGAANSRAFKLTWIVKKTIFHERSSNTYILIFWIMWADSGVPRRENMV